MFVTFYIIVASQGLKTLPSDNEGAKHGWLQVRDGADNIW
jgi:hypothetical protein